MKALVFAGTTEGREAALMLARTGISVTAFTATDYGHEVLDGAADGLQNLTVESGRLSEEQIRELLLGEAPDTLVIDATHPPANRPSNSPATIPMPEGKTALPAREQDAVV